MKPKLKLETQRFRKNTIEKLKVFPKTLSSINDMVIVNLKSSIRSFAFSIL